MSVSAFAFQSPASAAIHTVSAATRAPRVDEPSGIASRALDAINDGLIVANAMSHVLYVNRAGESLLSSGGLTLRAGCLSAETPAETRTLQLAIAGRARPGATDVYLRLGGGRALRAVFLTITATQTAETDLEPKVLIFARQLNDGQSPSPQMIATFFGLTPAEARLACEMIKGDGMKPCARRLGITANTARTHLKHVFEKTGTRRQAELVRLLFSCGASIGARCIDTGSTGRPARPLGRH